MEGVVRCMLSDLSGKCAALIWLPAECLMLYV